MATAPLFAIAVERDPAVLRRARVAAVPTLVFPLEASVIDLVIATRTERLHRSNFALVPARARFRSEPRSPAPKLLSLEILPAACDRAVREYAPHVVRTILDAVLATARVLPRTRWVDELAQRYLFEREICERHASLASRFLEIELTKEVYFLGEEQRAGRTRLPAAPPDDALVERARAAIEATLFEPFSMAALARACHASESTLLRTFRRELGVTPGAYVRERRLDEALALLETGRYTVGEVAARVGYTGHAAFAVAFQRKFHVPPSRVRPGHSETAPLAPHGAPPERPARRR